MADAHSYLMEDNYKISKQISRVISVSCHDSSVHSTFLFSYLTTLIDSDVYHLFVDQSMESRTHDSYELILIQVYTQWDNLEE